MFLFRRLSFSFTFNVQHDSFEFHLIFQTIFCTLIWLLGPQFYGQNWKRWLSPILYQAGYDLQELFFNCFAVPTLPEIISTFIPNSFSKLFLKNGKWVHPNTIVPYCFRSKEDSSFFRYLMILSSLKSKFSANSTSPGRAKQSTRSWWSISLTRLWNFSSLSVKLVATTRTLFLSSVHLFIAGFTAGSIPIIGKSKFLRRSSIAMLVAVLHAITRALIFWLARNSAALKIYSLTLPFDFSPYGTFNVSA